MRAGRLYDAINQRPSFLIKTTIASTCNPQMGEQVTIPDRNTRDEPGRSKTIVVLAITGICGFCLGMFSYPEWQDAVEPAQVVARIVEYPSNNPYYIYQVKVWTILHQVCAVLLRLGLSEELLSLVLSGIVGMISFQALGLCSLALSNDIVWSAITPCLVLLISSYVRGPTYPIVLMGSNHTYGMLGLSAMLLAVGLVAVGNYRIGGFSIGIFPAIHASLGMWLTITLVICALCNIKTARIPWRRVLTYAVCGYCTAAISLLVHRLVTYDVPQVPDETTSAIFNAFVQYWDVHRRPFGWMSKPIWRGVTGLLLSILCLAAFMRDLPRPSRFLLQACIASALIGSTFAVVHRMDPANAPRFLLIAMPARLLNFSIMACPALLIGMLARYQFRWLTLISLLFLTVTICRKHDSASEIGLVIVLCCIALCLTALRFNNEPGKTPLVSKLIPSVCLVFYLLMLRDVHYLFFVSLFALTYLSLQRPTGFVWSACVWGLFAVVSGIWLLYRPGTFPLLPERFGLKNGYVGYILLAGGGICLLLGCWALRNKYNGPMLMKTLKEAFSKMCVLKYAQLQVLVKTSVVALVVVTMIPFVREARLARLHQFNDRRNDALFARASAGDGLLLTCSNLRHIQLRTRRPVLLNGGALGVLPMASEAGPEMNRILRAVYAIDLLNPISARKRAADPRSFDKSLWERRSLKQWVDIKRRFGVKDIMTRADYKLQLPLVIKNKQFALYSIPSED